MQADIVYTYKDRYRIVFENESFDRPKTVKERVIVLARLIYSNDRAKDKEDCLVQALEEYEEMCGVFYDPSKAEYTEILASVY